MRSEELVASIGLALADLDEAATLAGLSEALGEGVEAKGLLERVLIPGLEEVGRQFEAGEVFLPELMMAAEIANQAFEILRPRLRDAGEESCEGKVVIGTVRGDVHDLGKNIVVSLLRATGFEVVDLGVDVDPDRFVDAATQQQADVVGLSALVATGASAVSETITVLRNRCPSVKVILGGAAMSETSAEAWGADAYARDAWAGVDRLRELTTSEARQ
jgi:methylmalonyl-CoA mutase cobalamin-binding domain/chain